MQFAIKNCMFLSHCANKTNPFEDLLIIPAYFSSKGIGILLFLVLIVLILLCMSCRHSLSLDVSSNVTSSDYSHKLNGGVHGVLEGFYFLLSVFE